MVATLGSLGAQAEDRPDARASDPQALGWMQGSPPPPDKLIRFDDGSFYTFPKWRWSFSHWRELRPTVGVARGDAPPRPLEHALRDDLDTVTFLPMGESKPMSWADSLAANYTDGIVVLHKGKIVYERYFGALAPERQHIAFSVTKSFTGTLASMLIAEGRLDPAKPVSHYLPELARSGFADATVQQVLDMTTTLAFNEEYTQPGPEFGTYMFAMEVSPRPTGYDGPRSLYDFLPTIGKGPGEHGQGFTYRTPNTDVVGWLVARVSGQSPARMLGERIWSRLGVEDDAYLQVDSEGTPLMGLSLNARLRDVARFGEMMRQDGRYNGKQIVPAQVIEDIRRGASREAFVKGNYPTLPGWSYHNQWWISHDEHGAFMARGIHGQAIYIDPKAEMVIARFASSPLASNRLLDPVSLPSYRAIAEKLLR